MPASIISHPHRVAQQYDYRLQSTTVCPPNLFNSWRLLVYGIEVAISC